MASTVILKKSKCVWVCALSLIVHDQLCSVMTSKKATRWNWRGICAPVFTVIQDGCYPASTRLFYLLPTCY